MQLGDGGISEDSPRTQCPELLFRVQFEGSKPSFWRTSTVTPHVYGYGVWTVLAVLVRGQVQGHKFITQCPIKAASRTITGHLHIIIAQRTQINHFDIGSLATVARHAKL